MLSWLKSPFKLATVPSVLLVVGNFGSSLHIIHPVPENSINERFSSTISSSATTFRCGDVTEEAREQIGSITLHAGHGETVSSFLDDVEARLLKLRDDSSSLSPAHPQTASFAVTQLVQHVLNPAAMAVICERETRESSKNATRAYAVFIVYIRRPKAGPILRDPTSLES